MTPFATLRGRVAIQHRTPGRAVQVASMTLLALSALFPLYFMVSGALRTQLDWANSQLGLPTTFSFRAFSDAWRAASLGTYLTNTVIVTTGAVAIALAIAAVAGFAFAQLQWRGRSACYYFVLVWLAVPPVALLIPVYAEMSTLGLIDSLWSVILLYAALNTPFNVYLMSSYLSSLPPELTEAARVDGAGLASVFFRVILPMSRPALATLAVFNFLFAWNEFSFALVLLQDNAVKTATIGVLQLQGRASVDYPVLVAGLLITSLPVLAMYVFFQRYLVRAIVAGAGR